MLIWILLVILIPVALIIYALINKPDPNSEEAKKMKRLNGLRGVTGDFGQKAPTGIFKALGTEKKEKNN